MAEGCGAGRGIPHSLVFPLFSETGVCGGGVGQLPCATITSSPQARGSRWLWYRGLLQSSSDAEPRCQEGGWAGHFLLVLLGH